MLKTVSSRRLWVLYAAVVLIFLIIAYQALQLTVLHRSSLLEQAQKQHHLTVTVPPLRGAIVDRSGRELATNLRLPSVYAVPRILGEEERADLTEKLSALLHLDKTFVESRLAKDKSFVWIKRKISLQEAEELQKIKSPALGVIEEYKRFYPQGYMLSQVLGFTNIDNQGLEGIELWLNDELKGQEGKRYTKRDALGREIRAFDLKTIPAVNGKKVVLTIDQYLQYLTERALDQAFKQWKAQGASAIIMNPKTGEILAMANRPTFDPNEPFRSTAENRRNRSITDVYEPGSVFKIVASSAVLNEGKAELSDTFFCENGKYQYGSRILRDVHAYGNLSFSEVLIKSSNIGTVKMAALLKPETFQSYIDAYGFGRRTGIDFPGEVSGYTRPPAEWSKTSPYNIPMGHEILTTALQMTRAFAVIANGGSLVKPYIIARVEDQQGVIIQEKQPHRVRQVIREDVAAMMREILRRVVEEGTGKKAAIPGISVGGKTGTAQKVLPGGRGYSHSNFISSFIGFAPAEDPLLVMSVVLDDPKPRYYGGTVAAPVFQEVIEAALLHLGYIPETAKPQVTDSALPETPDNQPMLLPVRTGGRAV